MGGGWLVLALLVCLSVTTRGEDPYLYFTWNVTYGTIIPMGVPQQGILINGEFPGPNLNTTTNNNVVINVFNNIDEPLLFTWNGIQQRKNSWQDGTLGTMCPIAPGTNYTYKFQVKDQIGSYFYYPVTSTHRTAGGFGGLRINSRLLIPVPYADPEDDYTILINDWYTSKTHKELKQLLDSGRTLARPDGILINGKYGKVSDTNVDPLFTMKTGKTYKYRICNVGFKYSLNFRIQGHNMKLVEMEGSHVVQNEYESLDVHVGQCYSVLVTADKEPNDYYIVASTRFAKEELVSTGIIRYTDSIQKPSDALPKAPQGWAWSLNQFRTFRWNLTASAARPNPQGSYHYGQINITRTIKLVNSANRDSHKLLYAINGVSHTNPATPLKLAEYYQLPKDKVFNYNIISDEPPVEGANITQAPNVMNITFRTFVEIIFENHENTLQSWHLDGYSFFAVAIEPGTWTPEKRKGYNLLDAVSRHTIQVFPKSWAAIMLTFDNAGMWNLRSEMLERRYLGQELYISVTSPERSLRDEYNLPDDVLTCGIVEGLPRPPPYSI